MGKIKKSFSDFISPSPIGKDNKYKKVTEQEIKEILSSHKKWLEDNTKGKRAEFVFMDLSNIKLCGACLNKANFALSKLENVDFRGAELEATNFAETELISVNFDDTKLKRSIFRESKIRKSSFHSTELKDSDFRGAQLSNVSFYDSSLRRVNFEAAELVSTSLNNADITGVNFYNAKLDNISHNSSTAFFALQCPEEGSFIAFYKAGETKDYIIKMLVPEDAQRSSGTNRRCLVSKAKVLSITHIRTGETIDRIYTRTLRYDVDQFVEETGFSTNRWNERYGIPCFITKQEAINDIEWGSTSGDGLL